MPVRVATSVAEIRDAKECGDIAVVLHFQGSEPLRAGSELVGAFARLGVRVIQPMYNYRSAAGDGCCEPENAGLSLFGKELVTAMNQHRMAVDIAHAEIRTSLEATRPVRGRLSALTPTPVPSVSTRATSPTRSSRPWPPPAG